MVAFDGFAKLFENSSDNESDSKSYNSTLGRNNYQFRSSDDVRKSERKDDKILGSSRQPRLSFDDKVDEITKEKEVNSKNSTNYNSLDDEISTVVKSDIDKQSERNTALRNRLSEDGRHIKSSTLNERQLLPIKRLNHSLKDANIENTVRTPILTKNNKTSDLWKVTEIEKPSLIKNNDVYSKANTFMTDNKGSRNHSIYSPVEERSPNEIDSNSLTDKFIRRSIDFNKKKTDFIDRRTNKNSIIQPNFATLSFNSRRANQNRDLKESVSS